MKFSKYILLFSIIISLQFNLFAGKLDDFEEDVTKEKENEEVVVEKDEDSNIFVDILVGVAKFIFTMSAEYSDFRVSDIEEYDIIETDDGNIIRIKSEITEGFTIESEVTEKEFYKSARKKGEPLIPFAEFSANYSYIESDISSATFAMELGKGRYGFRVNSTLFLEKIEEDNTTDKMYATNVSLLFRGSFGTHVEIDFAPGWFFLNGNSRTDGFAFSFPIRIQFSDHISALFRPGINFIKKDVISDMDSQISYFNNQFSVNLGYRSLSTPNYTLAGPYLGISYRF